MCDPLPEILKIYMRDHEPALNARKQDRHWAEVRISPSLINQYPDVYWRVVFTMFENDLRANLQLSTVAAFLDCHGFVPAEYHHEQTVAHPYRTQDRPRLRQLWQQSDKNNVQVGQDDPYRITPQALRIRAGLVPPAQIEHLAELSSIWPIGFPQSRTTNQPATCTVSYADVQDLLIGMMARFKQWNDDWQHVKSERYLCPFTEKRVYQTRLAYCLTVFERFRLELNHLRDQVMAIAPIVREHKIMLVEDLQKDPNMRTEVYRGLLALLAQSPKFFRAHLRNYLELIGVHAQSWDWREADPNVRSDDDITFYISYNKVDLHPVTGTSNNRQILEVLARLSIISPDVTNGQLMEFLVDAAVEYAEDHFQIRQRQLGHDLRPINGLLWLDEPPAQGQYAAFDPIAVRSRIIWLCLVRYLTEFVAGQRRLEQTEQ